MRHGSATPAMKRAIIEAELIDEFHWLPQDIRKIPYKDLQTFYIIRRQRNETISQRQALEVYKRNEETKSVSSGRGQTKRTVQVTKLTP